MKKISCNQSLYINVMVMVVIALGSVNCQSWNLFDILSPASTTGFSQLKFKTASAGTFHSLGIKSDGTLWAWGFNSNGQLGNGDKTYVDKNIPVLIDAGSWQSISASETHSLGIKTDGTLWAWGSNTFGEIGDNAVCALSFTCDVPNFISSPTPGAVWVSVSTGLYDSFGILSDGTLWAWGHNVNGQLGDGTLVDKLTPVQIASPVVGATWVSVSAGHMHTLGILSDGTLWAWGYNLYGQLGDNTSGIGADKSTPVQIVTPIVGATWVKVSGGGYHTLALLSDGTVWAWGYNAFGQLGDATNIDKLTPVQIIIPSAGATVASVDTNFYQSLALLSDGSLLAWGYNIYGQLGDGTNLDKWTPVHIAGQWQSVSAGLYHGLAIDGNFSLSSWGYNFYGQLGHGDFTDRWIPTSLQ